jgi:hypothetical protein
MIGIIDNPCAFTAFAISSDKQSAIMALSIGAPERSFSILGIRIGTPGQARRQNRNKERRVVPLSGNGSRTGEFATVPARNWKLAVNGAFTLMMAIKGIR